MTRSRTPLVDVHAHFVTDGYVAAAVAAGHREPDGMPGWPAWDAGRNLEMMDQWGVGAAVLSVSSPGTHFGDNASAQALSRQVNEFGAALTRKYPGRFGHFASLPLPDVAGCVDELRYALDELGSDGVIVLTNAHGTYLGDDSFEPLWAELSRRHAVVFVHPTSPPCAGALCLGRPAPMMEFIFDTSRTVADLLFRGVFARHPDIEWIFAHGGGALPLLADRLELFRTVFPGGSGSGDGASVQPQMRRLWFDMAGTPFPHQVPALVEAFGSDRVLYGSDSCWTPAAGVTAQVASIDAASPGGPGDTRGGPDWRALTSRNAARLLHRLPGVRQAVSPTSSSGMPRLELLAAPAISLAARRSSLFEGVTQTNYGVVMSKRAATPVRFDGPVAERLASFAAANPGMSLSSAANRLVDEALRMSEHPGIMFRPGPTGRRAALAGGPDVWEVVRAVRSARTGEPGLAGDGLLGLVAGNAGTPLRLVRAAVRYWASYPEEVDAEISAAEAAEDAAEQAWRREHQLLGR
jgi:6-methylsalicylate decarboxylase